ncbi:MAG: sigma-70 family RNA polymerase sigma factor, partial [Pseudomonadota bacterium]
VAVNAARDFLRRSRRGISEGSLEDIEDPAESPAQVMERKQALQTVRGAVKDLPERQRLTLQLRVYEGMDYEQIAKILGGSAAGAKGNFHQALKNLRQKLHGDE